jgi:hypothetical protein
MIQRTLLGTIALTVILVLAGPLFGGNIVSAKDSAKPVAYELYFGDLHTHTTYSDAWEGTPWDAFSAAKAAGADFMATTDHEFYLTPEEWADTLLAADYYTSQSFVAMAGYEFWMTADGEINVYNTPNLPPEVNDPANHGNAGTHGSRWDSLPTFYDWLAGQQGAVGQFNHPTYVSHNFVDFAYLTEKRDKAMGMIEVYNSKYMEPSYVLALDKGWHVMPTSNSDTHSPDWISGSEIRTVLLAPRLTPDNLYAAMSAGRGYATLDKNLRISYTLNGKVMGSTLDFPESALKAWVHIEDPDAVPSDEITLVEIVSDGGAVVASIQTSGTIVDMTVPLVSETAHYYYVRVSTASSLDGGAGVTAWTAPVWTGR